MTDTRAKQGVALIYVMLIFVTVCAIALGLIKNERLDVLRTARFIDIAQARQYALGAESYAVQVLHDDLVNHGDVDYAGETWGKLQPGFKIEDGGIEMQIEDLRSRFNVSSVITGNPIAQMRFIKLCAALGIDEAQARAVLTRIMPDSPPPATFSTDVSAVNIITLPPGIAFSDASELIDAGLPVDAYRRLEPYVIALPNATLDMNVNTASDMILRVYFPDTAQADSIRSLISGNRYITVSQLGQFHINDPTLRVTSDFFRVHVTVRLREQIIHLTSTIQRVLPDKITIIGRAWTH